MGWSFMSVNIGGKEVRRGDKVMSGQEKKEDDKLNPLDYACEILLSKLVNSEKSKNILEYEIG